MEEKMARNNDESRYDRILERIKNLRLPLLTLEPGNGICFLMEINQNRFRKRKMN